MNISAAAIRTPLAPLLLFAILLGAGVWGFMRLPVTTYPRMDVPKVSVTVTLDDAAPDQIETEIAMRVEDALSSLTGLDEIETLIEEGRSVTEVEFATSVPVDRAVAEVRDAVSAITADLPPDADPPIIRREEQENAPILTYAIEAPGLTTAELTWRVDDSVIRRLQGLPQVRRVERVGGAEREIEVQLDPVRVEAYGLTVAGIAADLARQQIDLAVGTSQAAGRDRVLRVDGSATTVDALGDIALAPHLRLRDVAQIVDGADEERNFVLIDGREAVGLRIYPARDASDLDAARAVKVALAGMDDIEVHTVADTVTFTEGNYTAAMQTLAEGALLAVIVVFLFLRDWRATLVVALALPLSVIPTFVAMQMLGFSLNIVSTLAITLVTGILVDDAIVEIEAVAHHRRLGKSVWRAALDASDEIGLAVIAISATIIAVFLPVGLMEGIIGQYFRQFGLTVAVAVFFSLLVARLLTPLLAARILKDAPAEHEPRWTPAFRHLVTLAVRWRWATMGVAAASVAGGMALVLSAPTTFLPEMDMGSTTVTMELPPGTTLTETRAAALRATQALQTVPAVRTVLVNAGHDAAGLSDPRLATVTIGLIDQSARATIPDLRPTLATALAAIPHARFELLRDEGGREVSVGLRGRDGEATAASAARLLKAMSAEPMFVTPISDMAEPRPVLRIVPDTDRAADIGISAEVLAQTIRLSATGMATRDLPDFLAGPRRIAVRARLTPEARDDLAVIDRLAVPLPNGGTIPLAAIASITTAEQTASIRRVQQMRQVEVSADMAPGVPASDGLAWLAAYRDFPPGVGLANTGDAESQDDTFAAFASAMMAGIAVVVAVLILLFGRVLAPLTVLAALPLSISGVGVALWTGGMPISLPVVIGILMLMGIVTKNSILLVDVALAHEAAGMRRTDAAIEAAMERVRPIVMTTIAMVAGMVPSAIGHGAGGEFRAPLALVVIGGLAGSTLLSLLVIPALHCIVSDAGARLSAGLARRLRLNQAEPD